MVQRGAVPPASAAVGTLHAVRGAGRHSIDTTTTALTTHSPVAMTRAGLATETSVQSVCRTGWGWELLHRAPPHSTARLAVVAAPRTADHGHELGWTGYRDLMQPLTHARFSVAKEHGGAVQVQGRILVPVRAP